MTKKLEDLFTPPDVSGVRTALTEMNLNGRRIYNGQKIESDHQLEADIADGAMVDGYDKEGMFIITRIFKEVE